MDMIVLTVLEYILIPLVTRPGAQVRDTDTLMLRKPAPQHDVAYCVLGGVWHFSIILLITLDAHHITPQL